MDHAINQLVHALSAAPDSDRFRSLLDEALTEAAHSRRLALPWSPSAADPTLLGRLAQTVSVITADPDDDANRQELARFLHEECDRSLLELVRAVQMAPHDRRSMRLLCAAIEHDVLRWARGWSHRSGDLLATPGLSRDEAAHEMVQELWLHILDRDAYALRQFRGTTVGEWRAFLRKTVVWRLAHVQRATRTEGRRPAAGLCRLEDLPHEPANDGPVQVDAQLHARRELAAVQEALDAYERTTGLGLRNRGWFVRFVNGETAAQIAQDEPEVGRSGVARTIFHIRRFLKEQMVRKDESR